MKVSLINIDDIFYTFSYSKSRVAIERVGHKYNFAERSTEHYLMCLRGDSVASFDHHL